MPISSTQPQLDSAITVGSTPSGMVITGNYAYVANQNSGNVSVLDTRSGALVDTRPSTPTVVDPITVGGAPTGMAINPAGGVRRPGRLHRKGLSNPGPLSAR